MNVAFIPVRGGSKSIPLKNIKEIAGRPLLYWVTKAAVECEEIDYVFVSTDSREIRAVAESFQFPKVSVIGRGEDTAVDSASTESAMLEFASAYEFDSIVLIQATSPLLSAADLTGGFRLLHHSAADSVLSVVEQKRFIWESLEGEAVSAVNYDIDNRPRRQEFGGYLVENGAFYITGRKRLLSSKNRLSGRIAAYKMPPDTYFEIDEPDDWIILEQQLIQRERSVRKRNFDLSNIKMFLSDCDGCLTDGGMYYSEKGDELKKFNTKDGQAFRMLQERGIITGIITGEDVNLNRRRAQKLKLEEIISGSEDKASDILSLCVKYSVKPEEVLYVGDDRNDIYALRMAGFACVPADACDEAKAAADYVAKKRGGCGVIREIADILLQSVSAESREFC